MRSAGISMGGSSPLARGLQIASISPPVTPGIIPARAGFTRIGSVSKSRAWDHPRSRGVYFRRLNIRDGPLGSSPLARGLRPARSRRMSRRWIIPARAGFTSNHLRQGRHDEDHPRSRGVYLWDAACDAEHRGSSPLARGLRTPPHDATSHTGIIPARAGFTVFPTHPCTVDRDHPRSRGVYTCESLESQRTRSLPDPCCLHCRPRARSAELR